MTLLLVAFCGLLPSALSQKLYLIFNTLISECTSFSLLNEFTGTINFDVHLYKKLRIHIPHHCVHLHWDAIPPSNSGKDPPIRNVILVTVTRWGSIPTYTFLEVARNPSVFTEGKDLFFNFQEFHLEPSVKAGPKLYSPAKSLSIVFSCRENAREFSLSIIKSEHLEW